MVYRVRYKVVFFSIFNTCQSCKLKAKLIKVNGECIFFIKLSLAIDFALSYKQYRLSPQNQKYCRAKKRNNQAPKVIYKLWHRISEVARISGVAELAICWETRSAKDRQTQLWASWNLWGQIPRYIWLIKAVVSSQYKHLDHWNSPNFYSHFQSIPSNQFSIRDVDASSQGIILMITFVSWKLSMTSSIQVSANYSP